MAFKMTLYIRLAVRLFHQTSHSNPHSFLKEEFQDTCSCCVPGEDGEAAPSFPFQVSMLNAGNKVIF